MARRGLALPIVAIRTAKWPARHDASTNERGADRRDPLRRECRKTRHDNTRFEVRVDIPEYEKALVRTGTLKKTRRNKYRAASRHEGIQSYLAKFRADPKARMRGRYGRRADKQRIAEWMQTHDTNMFDDSYFAPTYNAAPQDMHPVVRLDRETGERELTVMRWGLVPYWSKDAKIGFSTINAKAETIATSPTYREAWKRRRCLVPAEWFYEWQKIDAKTKHPYAIALKDDSLFAFAGLWERWKDKATGRRLKPTRSSRRTRTNSWPRCMIECRCS